jgi:hypothetical protein
MDKELDGTGIKEELVEDEEEIEEDVTDDDEGDEEDDDDAEDDDDGEDEGSLLWEFYAFDRKILGPGIMFEYSKHYQIFEH